MDIFSFRQGDFKRSDNVFSLTVLNGYQEDGVPLLIFSAGLADIIEEVRIVIFL